MTLRGFHTAAEWARIDAATDGVAIETARSGDPTMKRDGVYLHSRYNPREEAVRLLDAADLNKDRPVLVIGLAMGYHVLELTDRGFDVLVVEPSPGVARMAGQGPLGESAARIGTGAVDAIGDDETFIEFAGRCPQVLVHPPTARLDGAFVETIEQALVKAALTDARLSVAVVGPMYGGSLPVASSLAEGFRSLGHRTAFIDNSAGWQLYESILDSIRVKKASSQLCDMIANGLNEWTYARLMQFQPDVVIVLAQSPVNPSLCQRLRAQGIVTAFWFVENWRHLAYWQQICRDYDTFFHIQPGEFEEKLSAAGCRHHAFVQTGCDPALHRPVVLTEAEKAEYGCDLSFAGAGYFNRIQTFLGLTDYHFKIWGVEWNAIELQRLIQKPDQRFTGNDFSKVCAGSKICLNLHSSTVHHGVDPDCDAINPRVFDIAACGGFQLCDAAAGIERYFEPETELPLYRDVTELRKKIDYFLARPEERAAIAARAHKRALAEHTYAHRAAEMLRVLVAAHGPRLVRKGIKVQRTIGEMVARAVAYPELQSLLASLPATEAFTHENMNRLLAMPRAPQSRAEEIFAYMHDVRSMAESLFEERQ